MPSRKPARPKQTPRSQTARRPAPAPASASAAPTRPVRPSPGSSTPATFSSTPRTEQELRDSEERMRAILETAVEGIVTISERGIVEQMNPAAERMFGYRASEVVGQNVSLLMPSPHRERHDQYLENYCQTGVAKIIGIGRETVGRRKDGSVFPVDLSVSEVRLASRRLFTGFVRDISERKQAESRLAEMTQTLSEKNKELETVVYVASHDLRSPLVNIQGFSKELSHACHRVMDLIHRSPSDQISKADLEAILQSDVPEALEYIQTGVAKMDALLSGFLRYSRLGRASLRIERLEMNSLMKSIRRSMDFQLKEAGATVKLDPLPACLGDSTQVNQVFSNLIDNAIKYRSPERPLKLHLHGWVDAGQAIFAVADNGIGIPAEHQGKVFEIFHRLHPSAGPGDGLGLTIAQRVLERHRGRIWLESIAGKGTTFFVSLPAADPIDHKNVHGERSGDTDRGG